MVHQEEGDLAGIAARLAEMSDEMRRIAANVPAAASRIHTGDFAEIARLLLAQRHSRKRFLPNSLFHEPAWEILLSLYVVHLRGGSLGVKQLVALVDAPVTTSQRWIDQLVHMKLLQRVNDPLDRRRQEISLTDHGAQALENYLRSLNTTETQLDDSD